MSPTESRATSPAQPYIGHQKENASGDDPRTPGGAQDPTAHLGNHSEACPEQTGVTILCCCPTCLAAFTGMSE